MKTTHGIHKKIDTPTTQPDERDQLIVMLQEQILLMQQDRETYGDATQRTGPDYHQATSIFI